MTDHEKLMVSLVGSDYSHHVGAVAVNDIIAMLWELGGRYRAEARRYHALTAAS